MTSNKHERRQFGPPPPFTQYAYQADRATMVIEAKTSEEAQKKWAALGKKVELEDIYLFRKFPHE